MTAVMYHAYMELFHVLNRGVDGRKIFMNNRDRVRFVHNLYEFNDNKPANNNNGYHFKYRDIVSPYITRKREKLVDIHGWVLMKNHYHLLLSERSEGGLSLFLRKLNVGYSKYFNEKYTRQGALFQGRTKKILIDQDAHFLYILNYIHLNPLDYLKDSEDWRIRDKMSVTDINKSLTYLNTYRWSSYLDYAGIKNFPSILTTNLFSGTHYNPNLSLQDYLNDSERSNDDMLKSRLE